MARCGGAWPSARWADAGGSAPQSPTARLQLSSTRSSIRSSSSRPTHRSAKAFARGARIGVGRIPMPSEAKIAAKVSVKVASRSRTRNLNCSMRSAGSMRRVRACWATHCPVGWPSRRGGGSGEWRPPARTARTGPCARRSQHGRGRRPSSLGLGGLELLPGRAGAAWCRVDTASLKEQPHRARCEVVQAGQVTVDAPVAPRRVVGCHRQDQATPFWQRRGPTGLAVRGPPAWMPALGPAVRASRRAGRRSGRRVLTSCWRCSRASTARGESRRSTPGPGFQHRQVRPLDDRRWAGKGVVLGGAQAGRRRSRCQASASHCW
jgi:hypothetical protein